MDEASTTTAAIQQYLVDLGQASGRSSADPLIRDLLARAVARLRFLCASLLHRSYPRLTQAPVNLETDDLLSAVVERLLKSLDKVRPKSVRQFFGLANQHMRWELNDLARRLDERGRSVELAEDLPLAPESSASILGLDARRMLEAIDSLPEEEQEVFSLVRIQGLSQTEVATLLGISTRTVLRRLNRSLLLLAEKLADLCPDGPTREDATEDELE
ncbi:MAG: sigma-70 family RNA polymerase sigma factor [Deltaproteobacteria bacterium]